MNFESITWLAKHVLYLGKARRKRKKLQTQKLLLKQYENQLSNIETRLQEHQSKHLALEAERKHIEQREDVLKVNENILKQIINDKLHSKDFIEMTQISLIVHKLSDDVDIMKVAYKNKVKSFKFHEKQLQDTKASLQNDIEQVKIILQKLELDLV